MEINRNLSVQYFVLIQLAQDEMARLYNCNGSIRGKGYYYDVVEVFNKAWKKLNRIVPKGEYDHYRDAFCEAADGLDGEITKVRDYFRSECATMFECNTDLLAYLVTAKFLLRSADGLFSEMYGDQFRSKLVAEILAVINEYAKKFKIRGNRENLTIKPDMELVNEFNNILIKVAENI